MPPIMPLGQSSQSPFPMEKYTPKHSIHAHSPNPNSIMTPTTKNSLQSLRLSPIGATIWKDLHCLLMWSPTIKTWYISPQLNSLHADKPNGPNFSRSSISSSDSDLENLGPSQML